MSEGEASESERSLANVRSRVGRSVKSSNKAERSQKTGARSARTKKTDDLDEGKGSVSESEQSRAKVRSRAGASRSVKSGRSKKTRQEVDDFIDEDPRDATIRVLREQLRTARKARLQPVGWQRDPYEYDYRSEV